MKWETYNKLTTEQKEEFDFKFDRVVRFDMTRGYFSVITPMLIIILLIFTALISFMILTGDPISPELISSIGEGLLSSLEVIYYLIIIGAMLYLIEFMLSISRVIKRDKWLRENLKTIEEEEQ